MENRDENSAAYFAYLRDVLGVRYLSLQREGLEVIAKDLAGCTRCKLSRARKNIVFGSGNPKADLMFIGEGPGEQEDLAGEPFVGASGQLLSKMIEAMGYKRGEVFLTDIVKCRPPLDRDPEAEEVARCSPFLERQIAEVSPRVIILLGPLAAQSILKTAEKIGRLRGKSVERQGMQLIATYHPSYLLRNPGEKKQVWADLQLAMNFLKNPR